MAAAPADAPVIHVDGSMVEGLFVRALKVTGPLADELRRIGVDLSNLQPKYPRPVFTAALELAARMLYPGKDHEHALRDLGRRSVDGFLDTLLGKVISTAVFLGGPDRVIEKMPRHARTGDANYAGIVVHKLAPGSWRADVDDPAAIPDYFAGMTEAWLKRSGVHPTISIEHVGRGKFAMHIAWGKPA